MSEPAQIWLIYTKMGDLPGWYYVGVETESEARRMTTERRPNENIIEAKPVNNVDHVKQDEFRPFSPITDYRGPFTAG